MKIRYALSGPLMMAAIYISMIRVDITGDAPKFVWALLTFASCLCTFFGIKWFMDMAFAINELNEKIEWQEKVLKDHKDLITDIHKSQIEGRWLDTGDEELDNIYSGYKCSVCGFVICGHSGNYCCNCGAKMKPYQKEVIYEAG